MIEITGYAVSPHGCGCDSCLGLAPPITETDPYYGPEDDRVAWGSCDHEETLRWEREDEESRRREIAYD